MVAATLPWPRSLPLRAAAAAREYHHSRRSIKSKTFAAAAPMTSPDESAIELLAKDARSRAPNAAWSPEPPAVLAPPASSSNLPLSGLTFASKEMYDVAGHEPAFGSPAYRRWRKKMSNSDSPSTSTSTAPVVAALVAAGATLVGRTSMSELAYALTGDHSFYPVPPNPAFENDE